MNANIISLCYFYVCVTLWYYLYKSRNPCHHVSRLRFFRLSLPFRIIVCSFSLLFHISYENLNNLFVFLYEIFIIKFFLPYLYLWLSKFQFNYEITFFTLQTHLNSKLSKRLGWDGWYAFLKFMIFNLICSEFQLHLWSCIWQKSSRLLFDLTSFIVNFFN